MILVYSTIPSKRRAREIGESLIRKKLVGCCNIFPIDSVYSWKGRVVNGKEFVMIIKTKKKNFKKVERLILGKHPDDTPCILELNVSRVTPKYLKWLNQKIK